ncbi:MAG TPA: hypothetical protein VFP01_08940 [Propionibacteriaceae bacterium]|nr:hypothetical protein [Propionibacteriaceae bacterium]
MVAPRAIIVPGSGNDRSGYWVPSAGGPRLIEAAAESARVRIIWPPQTTITTPAKYAEAAATVMRILANASTELARIKAGTRRFGQTTTQRECP